MIDERGGERLTAAPASERVAIAPRALQRCHRVAPARAALHYAVKKHPMSRRTVPLLFAAAALLAFARGAPEGQPFAPGVVLDVTLDSFDAEARALTQHGCHATPRRLRLRLRR